jgi:hypothetical protein
MEPFGILAVSLSSLIIILRIPPVIHFEIFARKDALRLFPWRAVVMAVQSTPILPCTASIMLAASGHTEYALMSHTMTFGLLLFSDYVRIYYRILQHPAYREHSFS